ncbi:MAG: hypothetical protein EA424_06420 [Planctomycetaceae bacterium]|nr:MAG: hypothetical protein EA424_06420 [Planctomycetaceae bacterium]
MRDAAKTVRLVLACLLLASFFCGIAEADGGALEGAVWLTPQSIVAASGPAYGTQDQADAGYGTQYGAARAIDDDPATFCCLLDDTPDASDGDTKKIPPGKGQAGHRAYRFRPGPHAGCCGSQADRA